MHGGSAAQQPPVSPRRCDDERLADLATEILAAAIRMAAVLDAAQQARSMRRDRAMVAAAGEPSHD